MNNTLDDLQLQVNNLKTDLNTFKNNVDNNIEEYTNKKKAIIDEFIIDSGTGHWRPKNWSNSDFSINSICYILSN